MRKTFIAAAAAFAVASGAMIGQAAAADLEYMPAPAPAPFIPTWQGFYIGGPVGYGEADFDIRQEFDYFEFDPLNEAADADGFVGFLNTFESGFNANGLLGGVQGGYNWQVGSMVFGIEGDVSFTDWHEGKTLFDADDGDLDGTLLVGEDAFGFASTEVDMLASVRGRLGFAMDSVLIYGTGGVAWADATARATIQFDEDVADDVAPFRRSAKKDFDDIGFVVGGGASWMVIPQTFSVGVEGLYYFFDENKTLIDETIPVEDSFDQVDIRATASLDDAWVIRARADFHF